MGGGGGGVGVGVPVFFIVCLINSEDIQLT